MAILYKTFKRFRIAPVCFLIALILGGLFMPFTASASNTLFTVDNVTVDVTAENAIKAREMAFEEAQVKAFEELKVRMLSEGEAGSFQTPPVQTISTMIQDYEVSNEKLSSKRYIGTYKVRFKDRTVKRYFSKQGAQYTDISSKPVLVLPFLETEQGPVLWARSNPWMLAWASTPKLAGGLVPLVVPLGDLSDVSDIGDDEALTYNRRSLNAMVARYSATEAVIAVARPEGTGLSVQLYRTDRARPEYVHQILERAIPGQSDAELYVRAAQSVKKALRQDWKKKTVVEASQHGLIQVRTTFKSLQEWSGLQRKLTKTQGVSDVALKALSPKDAYIDITYDGNLERLKLALQQSNLYLDTPRYQPVNGGNQLNQDYSQGLLGGSGANKSTVYELRVGKVNYGEPSKAYPSGQNGSAPGYQNQPYQGQQYQAQQYQPRPYQNQF